MTIKICEVDCSLKEMPILYISGKSHGSWRRAECYGRCPLLDKQNLTSEESKILKKFLEQKTYDTICRKTK